MDPKTYIIIFEVTPDRVDQLISAIKTYGTWAKLLTNTWAITTTSNSVAIRDHLRSYIGLDDRIFVIKSGIEAAWYRTYCNQDWLKNNL